MSRASRAGSWVLSLFVLWVWQCIDIADAHQTAQRRVIIRGELGSGPEQVGIKIENDYTFLPQSIAVATGQRVFVADHVNDKIVEFDQNGRYLLSITFLPAQKDYGALTMSDMATDSAGNLYVASWDEMRIDKYSQDGKLQRSISLKGKDICWNKGKGWTQCVFQISRLAVSADGGIFLRGSDTLIKLNQEGDVLQKWVLETGVFVVDQHTNLYMEKADSTIESYDSTGKLLWKRKCGESMSHVRRGSCQLPVWIDQAGNLYWFEDRGTTVIKTDAHGKEEARIETGGFHLVGSNTVKFDMDGSLYFLNSTKTDFWIEKIDFR